MSKVELVTRLIAIPTILMAIGGLFLIKEMLIQRELGFAFFLSGIDGLLWILSYIILFV